MGLEPPPRARRPPYSSVNQLVGAVHGNLARQLEFYEPSLYHSPQDRGFISFLFKQERSVTQRSYPIHQLEDRLGSLDPTIDTYISQGEFRRPNRQLVNLLRISCMFIDIDIYNAVPGLINAGPEQIIGLIGHSLPLPSLLIFSGRGYYAKWLLDTPLPSLALPRWDALQKEICEYLRELGGDVKALDASRVLRVAGTVNTLSGNKCKVVWSNLDEGGNYVRYSFDKLFDDIMPCTREELENLRSERARESAKKRIEQQQRRKVVQYRLNIRSLAWSRINDLRTLARLRGWKYEAADGFRDLFLFLATCFMSQVVSKEALRGEIEALGREFCPRWQPDRIFSVTSTAFQKAMHRQQYKFSNRWLIDKLHVSAEEERHLQTIISSDEARRREREAWRLRRNAEGKLSHQGRRDELIKQVKKTIQRMHAQGAKISYRRVAAESGVSVRTLTRCCTHLF